LAIFSEIATRFLTKVAPQPKDGRSAFRLRAAMRRTTAVPTPGPERFNIVLGIAVTIALTALLCAHLLPNRTNLKLGETATSDVVAQRTVR
jgi:hypothetical protein